MHTLILTLVLAQPPAVPQGPPPVPVAAPQFPSYSAGVREALHSGKPLVAYLGYAPSNVSGAVVCQADKLAGFDGDCVIVAKPDGGKLYWIATLQGRQPTVAEVQKEVDRPLAAPFADQFPQRRAQPQTADDDNTAAGPWPEGVAKPEGLRAYKRARYTQRISVTNGLDAILRVPRREVDNEWLHSGGLRGLSGWKSDVYKYVPAGGEAFVANLPVWNGSNFQNNRGWTRSYPDGTVFFDILSNSEGKVFEGRMAMKEKGKWTRRVVFTDIEARPSGYHGLKQSCASCHDHNPGSGGYAVGMISGADTVFSDPVFALER